MAARLFVTRISTDILGAEGPLQVSGGGAGRCFVFLRFWGGVQLDGGVKDAVVPMNSIAR